MWIWYWRKLQQFCQHNWLYQFYHKFTDVFWFRTNFTLRLMRVILANWLILGNTSPCLYLKKKFLADTCPFLGPLVPLFWISSDVSSGLQSGSYLICFFAEVNVMYILQFTPLVLHSSIPWHPVTTLHASAELGLGWDLNGWSLGQKTKALPLWQRPGSPCLYFFHLILSLHYFWQFR